MRDLIRISDEELDELTGSQRLRMLAAFSIAVACGIVSLQGMAASFTDAKVVPLPGMNQLAGQIAWATGLVFMLVGVTYLVQGVVKRRLQWAIALSLLIHFLLCASMSVVEFRGPKPIPSPAVEWQGATPKEFTLPDYAGEEIPRPDSLWRQQSDAATPENNIEIARSEMEIADADRPKPIDGTQAQEVEKLESLERKEQVRLTTDAVAEIERRVGENNVPSQRPADAPDVTTAESTETLLDVQMELAKQSSEAPTPERKQNEIASVEQQVEAAKLRIRRVETSRTPEDVQPDTIPRAHPEFEAAMSAVENQGIATSGSQQLDGLEPRMEMTRGQPAVASGTSGEPSPSAPSASATSPALSSVPLKRAAGIGDPAAEAPASGDTLLMARSNAVAMTGAAESGAESVEVSTVPSVDVPAMAESSLPLANRRGFAASVPDGLDAAPAAAGQSKSRLSAVRIERSANGGNQPTPGNTNGPPAMIGRGEGRQANAVGTIVDDVGVAATDSSGTESSVITMGEPASTPVGRSKNGLSSRTSSPVTISVPSSPPSSADSQTEPASSAAAVAGRRSEPRALLNTDAGFSDGENPGLAMSHSSAAIASLPAGAATVEQSGTLVFAGPQAAAFEGVMAGNGLSAPRMSPLPRRSAGLPGLSGPVSAAEGPSNADIVSPARVAVGSQGRGIGNDLPTLASAEVIAGMIRKSVPGLGGSPEARIAESLSMRTSKARREAARTLGGSAESEDAVERGLVWLALNQYPDGHWSIDDFPGEDTPDIGQGSFHADGAATGLALLAYLGAGYTHQSGKYQDVVNRGVQWLLKRQKPDGDLFAEESEFVWFYSHGMASIAVCEAYGLTKDAALKEPAQKALNFIVESQHPEFGGWRYRPRFESDTSVSGWQLMALKSGEMSGLIVPKEAYVRIGKWLDSVQSKTSAGQFSYHPSRDSSPSMTAEGLLMRQYLGAKRNDAQLIAGASFLSTRLPDFGQRDSYYWYYATQVMFHMQGEYWSAWNHSLRDSLVETQRKDVPGGGSWDPARPAPDRWATAGGRHYVTCLNLLMLEVYYRHLPLYLELRK